MGHAARRNKTAQAAQRGELLSRQSILGAMDHALELHAAALRLLEARIKAQSERIDKLETMLHVEPVAAPPEYTAADAAFQRVADTVETQMHSIIAKKHHSAQPCGCDAGVPYMCARHREEYADAD